MNIREDARRNNAFNTFYNNLEPGAQTMARQKSLCAKLNRLEHRIENLKYSLIIMGLFNLALLAALIFALIE